MDGFRASHAVVIGINGYGNGIPPLRTAVNDARRIAEVLETEFGYAVQLLTEDVTLGKAQCPPGRALADRGPGRRPPAGLLRRSWHRAGR